MSSDRLPQVEKNLNRLREQLHGKEDTLTTIAPEEKVRIKQQIDDLRVAIKPLERADHLDTANSLNNLALLYNSTGRYSEAEPSLARSLQIYERQLGADHPDTAQSLNNLAGLYESTGRYSEAEPLLVRSLQIREQQLGADHPDTASSLNNLAGLYESTGRYSEAEPLYLRAVVIFYNRLGETHPNTQTVWGNFIEFLRQVIQVGQTAQLSDHPTTQGMLEQLRRS